MGDRNEWLKRNINQNNDNILNPVLFGQQKIEQDTIPIIEKAKQEYNPKIKKLVVERFGSQLLKNNADSTFHTTVKNFIKESLMQDSKIGNNMEFIALLTNNIFDDIIGFGPIQPLLADEHITEIMVSAWNKIFVEKNGKLVLVPDIAFNSEEHLVTTIQKIAQPMGRKIDDVEPIVDTSLPDGSRVNATIPPASPDGSTLTIRKFSKNKLTAQDYLGFGSLDERMIKFLKFAVEGKANIIISGGTGTGKTTLLNMVSQFIPDNEAINTIEDTLELQLWKNNVRRFLSRPPVNGKGEITIRYLVKESLRQRPDRIVIGEIRDSSISDMLDAMSSGHEGGLSTVHSKSPKHLVESRIPILMGMSDIHLEPIAQKKLIADAIDLIVYIKRFKDGSRKITNITEVVGFGEEGASRLKVKQIDPNKIYLKDIFSFKESGYENGKLQGDFVANNYIPKRIIDKAAISHCQIDQSIFFENDAA